MSFLGRGTPGGQRGGGHLGGIGRDSGAGVDPAPVRLLTSPSRLGPRDAVPRKDGGSPRGIAEDGFPRREELTLDLSTLVDSINISSGARVGLGGPRQDLFPVDEIKPRVEDACLSA